jgi:hypothetical protein
MSTSALNNHLFSAAASYTSATQSSRNTLSQPVSTGIASGSDTVALSSTAQATTLHQQGLSVQQIASILDLTTAEVNGYLGTTTAASSGAGAGVAPTGGGRRAAPAAASGHPTQSNGNTAQPTKASAPSAGSVQSASAR